MRAIAPNLFADTQLSRLLGGRDRDSGRIVFPCPDGAAYEPVPLSATGTLWSYTVQRFRPKTPPYAGPDAFAPWIVAYVELADQVIVEARLVDVAVEDVTIGMPLRLVPVPLDPALPDSAMVPAFAPVTGGERADG